MWCYFWQGNTFCSVLSFFLTKVYALLVNLPASEWNLLVQTLLYFPCGLTVWAWVRITPGQSRPRWDVMRPYWHATRQSHEWEDVVLLTGSDASVVAQERQRRWPRCRGGTFTVDTRASLFRATAQNMWWLLWLCCTAGGKVCVKCGVTEFQYGPVRCKYLSPLYKKVLLCVNNFTQNHLSPHFDKLAVSSSFTRQCDYDRL